MTSIRDAKLMLGRTPESIETIRPLRDGVIADFIATEEMLRQFIKRAKSILGFRRPRILICVPAGATPVERRAPHGGALDDGELLGGEALVDLGHHGSLRIRSVLWSL